MANEFPQDDPINVWQSQAVEPLHMSIAEIRNKTARFERTIGLRNRRETIAAIVMIPVFVLFMRWFPASMARLGSGLIIAGLLYLIYRLNGKAAAARTPADSGFDTCVAFHRRELERQRDLLRTVWLWYIGPLVPGLLVFSLGVTWQSARPGHPADWMRAVPSMVAYLVTFAIIIRINWRAADALQRKIDELDRISGQRA